MTRKRYPARRDMPIFIGNIEVTRKFVLEEFAQADQRFLLRLAGTQKIWYAMDRIDPGYDLVEILRSRRKKMTEAVPAAILARLLGFAPNPPDDLPPVMSLEEAEAILVPVPEPKGTFFQKKTPAQLIAGRARERLTAAKKIDEESLRQLRVWLAKNYEFISTMRN